MNLSSLRTWIDIDLDAVVANYRTACSLTRARVICVLKANAYGHGAVRVAEALAEAGCRSFAVSCGREALQLRQAGIAGDILVMTPAGEAELTPLLQQGVTLTAASFRDLVQAEQAARALGEGERRYPVHLKLDSGFHRLGFACDQTTARALADLLYGCYHLKAEGIYSHLGLVSEERDQAQCARFLQMCAWLRDAGVEISDIHLCDSIGLVRYPQWHFSACRVGALLFGVRPSRSDHLPFGCRETLAFRAKVSAVHDVPAGEVIGYAEEPTERPMRVATVCAGYGDGYPRRLSGGRGQVLIRGQRAPVVGLICMDQLMCDVSAIPDCSPGDTATLLGGGIPCAEMAEWAQTNRNECLTILSRRPVRVYRQGGRVVSVTDELLGIREDDADGIAE